MGNLISGYFLTSLLFTSLFIYGADLFGNDFMQTNSFVALGILYDINLNLLDDQAFDIKQTSPKIVFLK